MVAVAQVFVYLQLLDFLTTMVGFRVGASEASPLTLGLMSFGPTVGVLASKSIAILLGGWCLSQGRMRVLAWANYYFAALVTWNLFVILSVRAV